MANKKSSVSLSTLFLLFVNRLFRLNKRTKCFFVAIFFLFLLNLNVERLLDNELSIYTRLSKEMFDSNDANVNTKYYRIEYNLSKQMKAKYKLKRDLNNIDYKTLIFTGRSNGSLNKKSYLIVEQTKVFDNTKYCDLFDSSSIVDESTLNKIYLNECPYKNCHFTCNKSKSESADAFLFHYADLFKHKYVGSSETSRVKRLLADRRSDQLWIIWNDEPSDVSNILDEFQFNWTISFRFDAEINDCAYGCTYMKRGLVSSQLARKSQFFADAIAKEFAERQNSAVWFVSNCKALFRINFYINLHKHFPITVFGECAKYIESKPEKIVWEKPFIAYYLFRSIIDRIRSFFDFRFLLFTNTEQNDVQQNADCSRGSRCESRQFKTNKFYLSFESRNCSSYITEKLWRILKTNMIPVVIQPNKEFYELVAPPDSFIHAQDFDYDPAKLAKYLHAVSTNFDLYFKHLAWKFNYDIVYTIKQTERRRMCDLCTKMNTERAIIYYDSYSDWANRNCQK